MSHDENVMTTGNGVPHGAHIGEGGDVVVLAESSLSRDAGTVLGFLPWWVVPVLLLAVLVAASIGMYVNGVRRQHRRTRLPMYRRIAWHMWPGPGFAGRWVLWREYGRRRARQIARRVRPSLSWAERRRTPTSYAVYHGRAQGFGYFFFRHRVYSTLQDNTLSIAPAQEGKSVSAVPRIWEAPGAALVTTIRNDLVDASAGHRGELGRVDLLNPLGVGPYGSTFKWNLVGGCEDYATAVRRAGAIVEAETGRGLSDAQFWQDQASMVLAAMLHAAALVLDKDGRFLPTAEEAAADTLEILGRPVTVQTVREWVDAESPEPYEILRRHTGANRNAALALLGLFRAPKNTRGSILTTLRRGLRFLSDETVVDMLTPQPGEDFDIQAFLRSRDTLYLIAPPGDQNSPVAPLLAAFCSELFHEAMLANSRARLDPPLTMVLDEVANICPVPLPAWVSYSAGSGVVIHTYFQSWAQAVGRWGQEGAKEVWNNSKMSVLWPSSTDDLTHDLLVKTGGRVRIDQRRDGEDNPRDMWEDALVDPGQVIPDGYVLCRGRGKRPTVVEPPKFWRDKRAGVELPPLPPTPARYIPEAMPELRRAVADGTGRGLPNLDQGRDSGRGHDGPRRRRGEAPELPVSREQRAESQTRRDPDSWSLDDLEAGL